MREAKSGAAGLLLLVALVAVPVAACAQSDGAQAQKDANRKAAPAAVAPAAVKSSTQARLTPQQEAYFAQAARTAWRYVDAAYQPATGLMGAHTTYAYGTVWDMASSLAALYSGHALGLIDDAAYDSRIRRALETLRTMPMHENTAWNKFYNMQTGGMVDRATRATDQGYGWSAIDLGRMLVWLKIIEKNQPQYAQLAQQVEGRLRMDRLVKNGYIWGENHDERGVQTYPEGRLGYEQYAARGFQLWGQHPDKALDLNANARPVQVLGHTVLADKRGGDKLTGEPFFLSGLELGWTPQERELSSNILGAQEERYKETGQLTMVSEDAINKPPYYFYYYCLYCDGKPFVVDAMGAPRPLDGPRWVSTKAAFAWQALLPGDYTWKVVKALAPAAGSAGWAAGIFEGNGGSTGGENLNTAAIVLESVLFARTGKPLIEGGPVAPLPAGTVGLGPARPSTSSGVRRARSRHAARRRHKR